MSDTSKYIICKTLDERGKFLWLPIEEIVPALTIGVTFLLMNSPMIGLTLGAAWFFGIRRAKGAQGATWLYSKIFWYGPSFLLQPFLKKTPMSDQRHWIS